jgi:hypothetical protein
VIRNNLFLNSSCQKAAELSGVAGRSRRPPSLYELRRAREAGKGRAIAKRRRDSAA